jgi:hypothetical protein
VLPPILPPGIVQSHLRAGLRIEVVNLRAFVTVAKHARESQILLFRVSGTFLGHDDAQFEDLR